MYPLIRTATTLIKARYRPRLDTDQEATLTLRVGLTDVDVFGELNNARHLNAMELGRWDHAQRIGFMPIMRARKWGVVVGGVSIRYRRRIPFLARYTVTTRLLCHDSRWFYFLQETKRKEKICSSALIKAGASSKEGLVDAPRVLSALGVAEWSPPVPPWVQAWIDAEGQRPWPEIG